MTQYQISFPAIRGIQAGREYYSAMVPVRALERMFFFHDDDLPASMKAQRTLNSRRANDIAQYVLDNPKDYVLPALVASIDGEFEFVPAGEQPLHLVGMLKVNLDAKLLINDGQHRRAGLIRALKENPELGFQQINVTLFSDPGFHRSQQIFSDINSTAVKVAKGLTLLYDKRSEETKQVRLVMRQVPTFSDNRVEFEKGSISGKSVKLFAYNGLHEAIATTLEGCGAIPDWEKRVNVCAIYWQEVAKQISEWEEVPAKELREGYLCTTAIALAALGELGSLILESVSHSDIDIASEEAVRQAIFKKLEKLSNLDWAKANPKWNGRCLFEGKIVKNSTSEKGVLRLLKTALYIPLDKEEKEAELEWLKTYGKNALVRN